MVGDAPAGALYKIVSGAEWRAAQSDGLVAWSAVDRRDGFMHLSTAAQVLETARLHFSGTPDLVALEIGPSRLDGAVRFEASRGGELFPHLYGDLSVDAVIRVRRLCEEGGVFRFNEEFGG
jgi:uncharacterized protein (DUF952 family)